MRSSLQYFFRTLDVAIACATSMAVIASRDFCFQELQFALDQANAQVFAATDWAEKRTMRATKKRLQDRMYQRKHRAKREHQVLTLEHDIQTLQTEVACLSQDLHHHKTMTVDAENQLQPLDESLQHHAQSIVTQFFHVYQDGYSLPLSGLQERFLYSILATDVEGVDIQGDEAFVQQWRLYDQHFALYALEPQIWTMQPIGNQGVMVEVEVMLYLRCHCHTITSLFPNLKTDRCDRELVRPLVTGTTAVTGTYSFVFNRAGYVSKLLVSLQLLETLRRVLGSLKNVVKVTDGGRIALGTGTITAWPNQCDKRRG